MVYIRHTPKESSKKDRKVDRNKLESCKEFFGGVDGNSK